MYVLGIESSCDETGIAIYHPEMGIVAQILHSQIATHRQYGGVVPELASRDHVKFLIPLLDELLQQANLTKKSIDAIAYTAGPGLIGALLTGACFAKSLALGLNKPAVAIHHLEAHLLAAKLDYCQLSFPFLVLLVSGGHTQLIEARALGNYKLLGETLDDAAGEAFDKTAKMMGLPYPGGPILADLADQCTTEAYGMAPFPRPMTDKPGLDLSFSGLKTHALTVWNHSKKDESAQRAIAQLFQQAVVETLLIKCNRALKQTGHRSLVIAGGVGANRQLRASLNSFIKDFQIEIFFPRPEYCTDNGAMIAYAGYLNLIAGRKDQDTSIDLKARWPFTELMS